MNNKWIMENREKVIVMELHGDMEIRMKIWKKKNNNYKHLTGKLFNYH